MSKKRFEEGRLTTNFIAEEYPDGFSDKDLPPDDPTKLLAIASLVHVAYARRAAAISGQIPGHGRAVPDTWAVVTGGTSHTVEVAPPTDNVVVHGVATGTVKIDKTNVHVATDWTFGDPLLKADVTLGKAAKQSIVVQVDRRGVGYRLFHSGAQMDVMVFTARQAELHKLMPFKPPPDLSRFLLSPMPGLLVSIAVTEGQEVKAGETLAIVEAMKMENVLKAERDGTVKKISEQAGASLAVDQVILEFA
ncbi:MAG: biotin/lipoyl-binding protein [Rhodospirillaceae bacterium]|nr:MAG: biotin/lipoyl-binding protein [Rhodospirillaceae bacterium]